MPIKKHARRKIVPPASDAAVLQVMPRRKVRLDPTLVPHFATWLIAMSQQWESVRHRPHEEKTDLERKRRAGHDAHLDGRISAVSEIVGRLYDQMSVYDIERAKAFVKRALADAQVPTRDDQPSIPDTV